MAVVHEIEERLRAAFSPTHLRVEDESAQHAGHAGAPSEGESHFRVEITAPEFSDLSRIARHRAVHAALGKDLVGRIHALALHINS